MTIKIPKGMFEWKTANIAPTLLGVGYLALPILAALTKQIGISISSSTFVFGMMLVNIGLIRGKDQVTVLGALFTGLLGIDYFMMVMTTVDDRLLWFLSIVLFIATWVFEIGVWKIGPLSSKAKAFVLVPLSLLGFSLLLALAGYNPIIHLNWRYWAIPLSYLAIMVFCFVFVVDYAGWKIFKKRTNLVMNLTALMAIGFSAFGILQGWGVIAW